MTVDVCTRPSRVSRQRGFTRVPLLAALLFVLSAPTSQSAVESDRILDLDQTQSITRPADHQMTVTPVRMGLESVQFRARLSATTNRAAPNVKWVLRNVDGEVLLDAQSAEAALPLLPGFYKLEMQYGHVTRDHTFNLLDGSALAFEFVLNAGSLRILPRLEGLAGTLLSSRTRIFSNSGPSEGKLIAESMVAGEVFQVAAGQYRIESRLGLGNAHAVVDVTVKSGKMSAVEINHNAGLVQLLYEGTSTKPVTWQIRRGNDTTVSNLTTVSAQLVLQPGYYTAEAVVDGVTMTQEFEVRPNLLSSISLGN